MAILFINVISNESSFRISYGTVAIDVLIVSSKAMRSLKMKLTDADNAHIARRKYLGIPLTAGFATRYAVWYLVSKEFLYKKFLPLFGPLALLGLLYTIFVLFAYQGEGESLT